MYSVEHGNELTACLLPDETPLAVVLLTGAFLRQPATIDSTVVGPPVARGIVKACLDASEIKEDNETIT